MPRQFDGWANGGGRISVIDSARFFKGFVGMRREVEREPAPHGLTTSGASKSAGWWICGGAADTFDKRHSGDQPVSTAGIRRTAGGRGKSQGGL